MTARSAVCRLPLLILQRTCTIPEGPELKISSELIRPLVIGKNIEGLIIYSGGRYDAGKGHKSPEGYSEIQHTKYVNMKVEDVNVKGKFMYWTFSGDWYMFCTYGMTGQWSETMGKHPCFCVEFSDGTSLYFNDPRHFGTIRFVHGKDHLTGKLKSLGWDPFTGFGDKDFNFVKENIDSRCSLAQLLMDQSIFAGVGNYIKSEALYLAKLSPHRSGDSLSDNEIYELCQSIMSVMQTSYQHQGATLSTFKTPYGEEGKYSTLFKVYGCKADPLGNKIIKETLADKRTTHWVPQVQR